jgi:hypothetical protein
VSEPSVEKEDVQAEVAGAPLGCAEVEEQSVVVVG